MSSRVRVLDARTQQLLHASAALPSVSALALSLLRRALERHARSIQLSIELGTPAGATLSCDDDGVAFTDGEELRQALMYDSNAPGGGGTLPLLASVVRALDLRSTSASKSCEALVKDGELEHVREGSSRKYLKGNRIVLKDLFYQWPVRRRALTDAGGRRQALRDLVKDISAFALAFPRVAFTVTDRSAGPTEVLVAPRSPAGILGRFRQLHGRQLVGTDVQLLHDVELEATGARVEGFIALPPSDCSPADQRRHRYLYVNGYRVSESARLFTMFVESVAGKDKTRRTATPTRRARGATAIFCLCVTVREDSVSVSSTLGRMTEGDEHCDATVELHDSRPVDRALSSIAANFVSLIEPAPRGTPEVTPMKRSLSDDGTGVSPSKRRRAQAPFSIDRTALRERQDVPSDAEQPEWLRASLEAFENPVFGAHASIAPSVPDLGLVLSADARDVVAPMRERALDRFFSSSTATRTSSPALHGAASASPTSLARSHRMRAEIAGVQLSAAELARARFIAQFDAKFLICEVPVPAQTPEGDGDERLVVLVDQHAAHERVRVERFLQNTCGAVSQGSHVASTTISEDRVTAIVLRSQLARLIVRYPAYFRGELERWGVRLGDVTEPREDEEDETFTQVVVETIPEIVAERLRPEPELLQEFVAATLQELESRQRSASSSVQVGENDWQRALKDCPHVLRELINSKACRGAIMFNDELTPARCKSLIRELAGTSYPFQCAHGRPSLLPLFKLPGKEVAKAAVDERRLAIDWAKLD